MIIREVPPDIPTTSNPPPPPPRIIEEVPNNAARKTLAELFASYPKAVQPSQSSTNTTINAPSQNGPEFTQTNPYQPIINTNATNPIPQNAPALSYNPTLHIGPPPRLWFPPRPPGQDIDGNASIIDNPWTPAPFSATMEDAPCTPGAPRSQSVTMTDRPWTHVSKPRAFFSDCISSTTGVSSEAAKPYIPKRTDQPPRRHSGVNLHFAQPYAEKPFTRGILATAPVLPNAATLAPKYVNPFLPRPITLPPRIPIPPKTLAENVSPRTPTAPVPQFPNAPFLEVSSHPFGVPPTVHVLADWPYGPLFDTMSPRTRCFAIVCTDSNRNKVDIYRPRLNRDTYLAYLPPTTRVEIRCTSRACGLVCELDERAGDCRQRSAAAKDVARWESQMWACEGCGKEMEMQVLEKSEGNSPADTGDASYKKDERDG